MINDEVKRNLIGLFINELEVKKSNLMKYGLDDKQLLELQQEGILKRVRFGYYGIADGTYFYQQALTLKKERKYEEASIYFKRCYDDKYNISYCGFQCFLNSLNHNQYDNAAKYLIGLYQEQQEDRISRSYNIMFFTLLSNLCMLPQEYLKLMDEPYEEIILKNNSDFMLKEKIREQVIKKDYNKAYQLLQKNFYDNQKHIDVQLIAMKQLILANRRQQRIEENQLTYYYQKKEYKNICENLQQKLTKTTLTLQEQAMLVLSKKYVSIEEKIPFEMISTKFEEDLLNLIEADKFKEALKLAKDVFDDTTLLEDIFYDVIDLKEQLIPNDSNNQKMNSKDSIENIIKDFQQRNYLTGIEKLKQILNDSTKSQYEKIVINSLKLSLLEEDDDFTVLRKTFKSIVKEEPKVSLAENLSGFYQVLGVDNAKASLYLEQLIQISSLGHTCNLIPLLKQTFKLSERLDSTYQVRLNNVDKVLSENNIKLKIKDNKKA